MHDGSKYYCILDWDRPWLFQSHELYLLVAVLLVPGWVQCHAVTLSHCHTVTLSHCHTVTQSHSLRVTPLLARQDSVWDGARCDCRSRGVAARGAGRGGRGDTDRPCYGETPHGICIF